MAERDVLSEMFDAWCADIESEPFPQFSQLLIPRQQDRSRVIAALGRPGGLPRVSKTTRLPRS